MCGISGIVRLEGNASGLEGPLTRMQSSLRHRGPDDEGIFLAASGKAGLGHTRLSILDLSSAGHQPMPSHDSRLWLSYNGEIYNYKELRAELDHDGTPWRSQTDTEVLLKAYERWHERFLPKLRGMFAFAIWNDELQQLLLARDPFGIKPLYYYSDGNTFVFASEVRALLASDLVPRKLSEEGLISYVRFGSVAGPLTMIEGVQSLLPGHYLTVELDQNRLRVQQNSYVEEVSRNGHNTAITNRKEAVRVLREKLEESVRLHLESDVPLAAFLSGGIDSSAIVGLMSCVTQNRPKTFTVIFGEKEFTEQPYAHLVSQRYGTEHQDVSISEAQLLAMLPEAFEAMDQPTMDGINTYVISKAVKEAGITVALSGLGSDELFGGYPSFRRVRLLQNLAAIPSGLRTMIARTGQAVFGNSVQQRKTWAFVAAGGNPYSTYLISRRLFADEEVSNLFCGNGAYSGREPLLQAADPTVTDPMNEVSMYELQGYMANTLLRDMDQMSMSFSLEARVPFVDADVVSFVLSLPGSWKVDGGRPKPLLIDAVGDLIPEEVWRRRKMGFTLPFERWMQSALKKDLDLAFSDARGFKQIGISEFLRTVWNNFNRDSRKERWARPWALYALKKWCELNHVRL